MINDEFRALAGLSESTETDPAYNERVRTLFEQRQGVVKHLTEGMRAREEAEANQAPVQTPPLPFNLDDVLPYL